MLKRTRTVNTIISVILGITSGSFIQLAVSMSSTYFGVLGIISAIGALLNIICGPEKKPNTEE